MLVPILQLVLTQPPPVTTPDHPGIPAGGIWTVWQVGAHWVCESPAGVSRAQNPQHFIEAAQRSGAKIFWFDLNRF